MSIYVHLDWEPLVRVGPFYFGMRFSEVERDYGLVFIEETSESHFQYSLPERADVDIYVEDGVIVSIGCVDDFLYHGENLLDLSVSQIIARLGEPSTVEFEECIDQWEYCFEDLGFTFWVYADSDFPKNISVIGPIEED